MIHMLCCAGIELYGNVPVVAIGEAAIQEYWAQRAKKDAEEQAKRKAEQRAKKKAVEHAKKEAEEEEARLEDEEQARKEAEQRAKKEAEEAQAKKEVEEHARKECAELERSTKAKLDIKQQAKKETEAKSAKGGEAEAKKVAAPAISSTKAEATVFTYRVCKKFALTPRSEPSIGSAHSPGAQVLQQLQTFHVDRKVAVPAGTVEGQPHRQTFLRLAECEVDAGGWVFTNHPKTGKPVCLSFDGDRPWVFANHPQNGDGRSNEGAAAAEVEAAAAQAQAHAAAASHPYEAEVRAIYAKHNPVKLEDEGFLDKTLRKYAGREALLLEMLRKKYEEAAPATAPAAAPAAAPPPNAAHPAPSPSAPAQLKKKGLLGSMFGSPSKAPKARKKGHDI
jgi:hypothetical protein